MRTLKLGWWIAVVVSPLTAVCQQPAGTTLPGGTTLPAGTPLAVQLTTHHPMKVGEAVRAQLLYPVYQDNQIVLPAHTTVAGTVVGLTPDRQRRNTARLRADFTPFHQPVVRFDSIVAPDGSETPIEATEVANGAPIYRVVRTPTPQGGLIGEYWRIGLGYLDNMIQAIIGPDKADRFLQFIYSQLPYHPERIQKGTAWTIETSAPMTMQPLAAPTALAETKPSRFRLLRTRRLTSDAEAAATGLHTTWILQAYLNDAISSEFSKLNQTIHATVAEPVLNPDGTVAVPTGSVLTGTVTQARPARHFDRAGVLRFNFSEIKLPGEEAQRVRATLTGADMEGGQLNMNSEGEVQPKPKDKILIPALLILLAARPLDNDGGRHVSRKDGSASSGLGLITLIVGVTARQPSFSVGIGAYSAAVSIYPRYFGKGATVAFPKDTRVVIQTTATRSVSLKPDTARE